ncbi:MAG: hypothetical protein SFW67_25055 [Myxococcaceae bacterium]|nr:hypothetical protein [Myxococcaceae bacterium]
MLLALLALGCATRREAVILTPRGAPSAAPTTSVQLRLVDERGHPPAPLAPAEDVVGNSISQLSRATLTSHLAGHRVAVGRSGPLLTVQLLDAWWTLDQPTAGVLTFVRLRATLTDASGNVVWEGFGVAGEVRRRSLTPFAAWVAETWQDALERACWSLAQQVATVEAPR